jgi:mRNA interferase MazF
MGLRPIQIRVPDVNDYAAKPRPAVIVQDDRFDATGSVTVCTLTADPREAPLFRPRVAPTESSGLRATSSLMVDKIITVPRTKIGRRIGNLDLSDMLRLNQAMMVFLCLAVSPRTARAG